MKFTLLYFNYFKKRIIKSQAATQSYDGPESANNSAQAYTNVIYIYIYIFFFCFESWKIVQKFLSNFQW